MTSIRHRRDTSAHWTAENPTLADGEIGVEKDTRRFKIGDGSSVWTTLPYFRNAADLDLEYISEFQGRTFEGRIAPDYRALPVTMVSPPTITVPSTPSSTSTISGARTVEPDADGAVSYTGAVPTRGTSYPDTLMLLSNFNGVSVTGLYNYPPWSAEFDHDGSVFEFMTKGFHVKFRVMVDGQYAGPAIFNSATEDGQLYVIKVDFGTRAVRRIRVEMEGRVQFGKIFLEPTAEIWAAPIPGPRVCIMGDSWTEPTIVDSSSGINYSEHDGWATALCRFMGWNDRFILGSGGTGYLAPGMAGRVKYRDRVANDVIARNPDVVLVAGGLNDQGFDDEDIAEEAGLLFNQIVDSLPGVRLYVIAPFYFETPGPGILSRSEAIESAVPEGQWFIDTLDPPFITGTGDQDALSGDGNADVYIGGDSLHPTKAGHYYLARRVASLIHATSMP